MQQTEKQPALAPPLFERLVADEREMLRIVIDAIPDPVFVRDRAGRHILDNRAHRTTFNLFKRNPLGATVFELHPREHALLYAADDERVMSTGVPILNREEPFTTTSGERGWFLTCKFPLRDAARNVTGVVGICRDITELKRASEALRENERLYHTLVAATNTGYALVNERGFVLDVNDEFVRLTGYTLRADVVGRALSEWTALHDLERSTREMATCLQTGAIRNVEIDYVAADGRIVPVEMNARMQRTAAGPRIVLFCRDISVRRRAEAERGMVDRRLQEKQKLESLGVMAGGIAHDFNNLLTGILGNATLAASKLADPALRHCLEQIETAAMRAGDLCHQMLAYAGKGRFHIRPLSLNSIISETISLLRISIKKNATLDLVLAPDLPPVLADATQMRQIIMNLVINASEAITDSTGHIRVQTRVMSLDRLFDGGAPPGQDALEGTFVAIEVRDDGAGMSPEVQARIFDPFFTTKFTGRGLGLAAVLGIVRGHRGTLHVESEPGCGTLFRVLLPVADASPELQPAIPDAADSWRGSGTVLVIDDEEAVRTTTAALLELLGFDVLVAPDGRVGVQIFSKAAETVRLVLLDLTMPHFSGEETLRAIRELRPDAAILLMSGFTEQDVARRFHGTELAGFLPKPFMLSTLRKKLYEVLVAHHSVQPCAEVVGAA